MRHAVPLVATVALVAMVVAGCGGGNGGGEMGLETAAATGATVTGKVTDSSTGKVIPNATVKIETKIAKTSATGKFALSGLSAGSKVLQVSAIGHFVFRNTVTLVQGTNTKNVKLQRCSASPYCVPFKVGDRWSYRRTRPNGSRTTALLEVTRTVTIAGVTCLDFCGAAWNEHWYDRQTSAQLLLYGRDLGGRHERYTPAVTMAKLPPHAPAHWQQVISDNVDGTILKVTVVVDVTQETISVPSGALSVFKHAYRYSWPGGSDWDTQWLEPTIGTVKETFPDVGGTWVDELKDFSLH